MVGDERTSLYERQWNEVDAIKSIYIDEYEEVAHPWSVDHPPNFILHLSCTDGGNTCDIDVNFRLSPSYPEVAPDIIVGKKKGLFSSSISSIQEKLVERARRLVGAEMIFELVEYSKELLAIAAKKKVSFHDEMTQRKNSESAVKETKISDSKELGLEVEKLSRKIQEDLALKEKIIKSAKEKKLSDRFSTNGMTPKSLKFDPPLSIELPDSEKPLALVSIDIREALLVDGGGLEGNFYIGGAESAEFLLSCVRFEGSFYHTQYGRKKIQTLCRKLQSTPLRYSPFYCRIFGATIVPINDKECDLWVISEYRDGISLGKLIDCSGTVSLKKAMLFLQEILQALVDMHSCNVAHQDLTLSNVSISMNLSRLKLINPMLTRLLRDLHQIHPISSKFVVVSEEIPWRPPEIINKGGQAGKKADIWYAGHLLLQLIYGKGFTAKFETTDEALGYATNLPDPIKDILVQAFKGNPNERPSAIELLSHYAFSPKSMIDYETLGTSMKSPLSLVRRTLSSKNLLIPNHSTEKRGKETSRYKTDFEEIQFLGKGAFGEVIKVRNRIDGRYYAIKRVRLDPSNVNYNKKILREVTTLSRLHHDRIVRYYQAWIEGGSNTISESYSALEFKEDDSVIEFNDNDNDGDNDGDGDGDGDGDDTESISSAIDGVSSRKLYPGNLIGSSASLSSIFQFHTGFTSEREISGSASTEAICNKTEVTQYLYIQMEYCPNQTLRDVIDTGVDEDECWRLFRQIVEGLCHLHSQGMIHRDLKPGNIFLDTNGDVKIGDFGLAVGNDGDQQQIIKKSSSSSAINGDDLKDSLTGGVGTPLYVSPEQEKLGVRYNQKVDMYSLGIILLEFLVPFSTSMERAIVIKEARSDEIKLPNKISGKAATLLKNLLDHDAKSRMSSDELLKSDLLPPKLEDEYINEAIRSVINPSTPYYSKLLNSLFSQQADPSKNYSFDYHSGFVSDTSTLALQDEIKIIVERVCRRHGAIHFIPPLFSPSLDNSNGTCMLMERNGQLVQISSDLVTPFARFVAQNSISNMKRYVVHPVFRENPAGGQPRQPLGASFDIIYSNGDSIIPELEAIKVATEVIYQLGGSSTTITIKIGHMDLFSAILTQSLIPPIKRQSVINVFAQNSNANWIKIKNQLISRVMLPTTSIECLGRVSGMKEFEPDVAMKRLEELLRSFKECSDAIRHLSLLISSIPHLVGSKAKVLVDPLFILDDKIYGGTVFQIFHEERKKSDAFAFGGDYRQLVDSIRFPTDRTKDVGAVGVVWDIHRLQIFCSMIGIRLGEHAPHVIIYSNGPEMLSEKLEVAASLWEGGIIVDLIREDGVTNEYVLQLARIRRISILIHLKDNSARGQFGIVKLKDLEKRTEVDISRTEIVDAIIGVKTSSNKTEETGSNFAPLNVSLFAPYAKMKGSQRSLIMEKAVKAMAPVLASFAGPKPIEVIAHDLNRDLIQKITDTLQEGEDVFKKSIDSRDDRETASKMRSLLKNLREKRQFAFLFNYRERTIDLVSLISYSF